MKRKEFLNQLLKISECNQAFNSRHLQYQQPTSTQLHNNNHHKPTPSPSPIVAQQEHCLQMIAKEVLILDEKTELAKWKNMMKLKRINEKRVYSKIKFKSKEIQEKGLAKNEQAGQQAKLIDVLKGKVQAFSSVESKYAPQYSHVGDSYLSIRQIQPQQQSIKKQPLKRSYNRPKMSGEQGVRRHSLTEPSEPTIQTKINTYRISMYNNSIQQSPSNFNDRVLSGHNKSPIKTQIEQKSQQNHRQSLGKIQAKKQIYKHYNRQYIPPPKITAKSYIIYQVKEKPLKSKIILSHHSKNSQEVASLTKIMTCILVIEICKELCLDKYAEEITIGKMQSSIGGTTAALQLGHIYNIQQLLYGLMLPSGNDASVALAVWAGRKLLQRQKELELKQMAQKSKQNMDSFNKHCQISQSSFSTNNSNKLKAQNKWDCYLRFIAEMNSKAKHLQMHKTNYANSHGLMNQNNKSSAYDIAILCEYGMQNDCFREIVHSRNYKATIRVNQKFKDTQGTSNSEEDYQKPNIFKQAVKVQRWNKKQDRSNKSTNKQKTIQIEWQNTHKLMHLRPKQYLGIKTGFTNAAGPCLSSFISINHRSFIIIVLGCSRMNFRFKETQMLKKWLYKQENLCKKKRKKERSKNEDNSVDQVVFERQQQVEQWRAEIILKNLDADDEIQD